MTTKYHFIAQVAVGAFAQGITQEKGFPSSPVSLSTHKSLEALVDQLKERGEIAEDAWIVDARNVPYEDQVREVVAGPMVNCQVTEDESPIGALSYVTPATKADRWADLGALIRQYHSES